MTRERFTEPYAPSHKAREIAELIGMTDDMDIKRLERALDDVLPLQMDTLPPEEVATPPPGYEWTGEYRVPRKGDVFAEAPDGNGSWRVRVSWEDYAGMYAILRRALPPTVTITVARDVAERFSNREETADDERAVEIASYQALENES